MSEVYRWAIKPRISSHTSKMTKNEADFCRTCGLREIFLAFHYVSNTFPLWFSSLYWSNLRRQCALSANERRFQLTMIHFLYFIILSIGKIVFFSECQILIMELKIRILNFKMVQRIEKGSTQPLYNKNYYL